MPTTSNIKTLLAAGRTRQAIAALQTLSRGDEDLHNEAIQLAARFSQYRRDLHSGTLATEDLNLESRRIDAAALDLLQRCPENGRYWWRDWRKLLAAIAAVVTFAAALAELSGYSLRDIWEDEPPPIVDTTAVVTSPTGEDTTFVAKNDSPVVARKPPPPAADNPARQASPVVDTTFSIRCWADRQTARYRSEETVHLYYQVSQPCYVRVLYLLADSTIILLANDYRVASTQTNQQLEIGTGFSVSEPYGQERLLVFAQTAPFAPLQTQPHPDDPDYILVTEGLPSSLRKTRGLKKQQRFAEDQLTIITTH